LGLSEEKIDLNVMRGGEIPAPVVLFFMAVP
jgi:hypothetical protein